MVNAGVKVVLRTRPCSVGSQPCLKTVDRQTVLVTVENKPGTSEPSASQQYQFKFDHVLHGVSQDEVMEVCGADLVAAALQGYNSTLLCYGQTGAGKTYTMLGSQQQYQQRGLAPRVLSLLFREVKEQLEAGTAATVRLSYLEIYNEQLYDLLDITSQPDELSICESAKGTVNVRGLTHPTAATEAEALGLLFQGQTNRVIGEHQLNRQSSRSHTIFSVRLELRGGALGDSSGLCSRINLVDLAGSERVAKTRSEGIVLREATNINRSLSILEQVIVALSDQSRAHVPYRSSKLTHMLKNSLGGNCKTCMIANVWPDGSQAHETVSTCRFAQRMMRVSNEVSVNIVEDKASEAVQRLERENLELRRELALHDDLHGLHGTQHRAYSQEQRARLARDVLQFLQGSHTDGIEPLQLLSVRHMHEALLACKSVYQQHCQQQGSAVPPSGSGWHNAGSVGGADNPPRHAGLGTSAAASSSSRSPDASSAAQQRSSLHHGPSPEQVDGDLVGDLEDMGQSGGVGVAPADAAYLPCLDSNGAASTSSSVAVPDRHVAFQDYRTGPGSTKSQILLDNKARLKQLKQQAKSLATTINEQKRALDDLKSHLDGMKQSRHGTSSDPASQMLAEDELAAVMQIREVKAQYREQYQELQMVKSEVDYTQKLIDQCTQELLLEFNTWFESTYGVPGLNSLDGVEPAQSPSTGSAAGAPGSVLHSRASTAGMLSSGLATPLLGPGRGSTADSVADARRPKVLASLVDNAGLNSAGQEHDADALVYFSSQQMVSKKPGLHRPGSFKKTRGQPSVFSTSSRDSPGAKQPDIDSFRG